MAGDKKTVPLITVSVQNLHYNYIAKGNLAIPGTGNIPKLDNTASIAADVEST